MNTVIINEKELKLNSGLAEEAFGKTNFYQFLTDKGLIFQEDTFTPWTFEKNSSLKEQEDDKEYIYYCGQNPLSKNAKTLLEYFNEGNVKGEKRDNLYIAVVAVVKALTAAATSDTILPIVGAGGIIVDITTNKVLFLPEQPYTHTTAQFPPEQSFILQQGWVNPTIKGTSAICFLRSLIIYKLLTKQYPYSAIDQNERTEDIFDKNFLPLGQCFDGINLDFAKPVNKGLRLNSSSQDNTPPETDFDFQLLEEAWNFTESLNLTENDIQEKKETYLKNQKLRIETQRKLRKYFTLFMISFFVVIGLIFMIFSTAKKQNSTYTSKGLTSVETLQGFFYGVNNKSIDLLQSLTNGDNPDKYVNEITNIFLIEKQVASFTKDGLYYTPATWLYAISKPELFNQIRVFGVTNVTINDIPQELEVEVHRKNQNPAPITSENGIPLNQNDTVTHKVEYYFLQTDPETSEIKVAKLIENYSLTYTHEKWLITDISSQKEDIPVDTEQFKADYNQSLTDNFGDHVTAVESLKEKYPWLPTQETMLTEQSYLMQEY